MSDVAILKDLLKEKDGKIEILKDLLKEKDGKIERLCKGNAELNKDLAEREKSILILRVRSRIEELEKRFLKPFMLKWTRYKKWTQILTAPPATLRKCDELIRFRNMITTSFDELISTICTLYGEFSDLAAHSVTYPIAYDEISITQMLQDFGMVPDRSKIDAVISLLTPIP